MTRSTRGEGSIYQSGSRWIGYVTVNGQRKYFSAKTKVLAAQKRRALLNQRDSGELAIGKSPTLYQWLQTWLERTESDHKLSTHVGYVGYVNNYIKPYIGSVALDKLTSQTLTKFYGELEERGFSGSTRHQVHSIIRVSLKWAVWEGVLNRNVAEYVKPPSIKKEPLKGFSTEEIQAIGLALMGNRYEARWHIGMGLGLRPGEAIALEWKHVDFENATLRVEQQIQAIRGQGSVLVPNTKTNNSTRTIPVPRYIMRMLEETRARQDRERIEAGPEWTEWEPDGQPHYFCFTQLNGQPLRPTLDTKEWYQILRQANVERTRRYTARHTAASWMIANGVDPVTVAQILGHRNANFTIDQYVHAVDRNLIEAAEKIDSFFDPAQ